MKHLITAGILIFTLISNVFAVTKIFIREYTYRASDYDSRLTCQAIAIK